jgi:hypothetical protein
MQWNKDGFDRRKNVLFGVKNRTSTNREEY